MHRRVDLRKSKSRAGGNRGKSARLSRRTVGPLRCAMSSPPDGWLGERGLVARVSEIEGKGHPRPHPGRACACPGASSCGGGSGRGSRCPVIARSETLNSRGQRDPPSQPSPTIGRRKTPVSRRAMGEGERPRFDRRTSLVVRVAQNWGYSLLSLTRASLVVNCQSALA